ncbi:MAG: hypothetical protein M1818_008211 [Claussenomyces sp. TS43310]|nr:MAG: hypothetical protein M1818_008211 [Claussenomyces sp. TS43310]
MTDEEQEHSALDDQASAVPVNPLVEELAEAWLAEQAQPEYLALCIAIKDQQRDMHEFLVHHYYHMNVSRFYIMDDRSDPPLSTYEDFGIPRSALTFNYYGPEYAAELPPGFMQLWLYDECAKLYRDKHTWIGFIDVDEFIEIKTDETMEDILMELEEDTRVGELSINWVTHISAGLLERPASSRQSFTECIDPDLDASRGDDGVDRHVKSIVKTAYFEQAHSSHMPSLSDGTIPVGEDGEVVSPGFAWREPVTRHRLALHHYVTKSKQEYVEKMERWKDDLGAREWDFWDKLHAGNTTFCPEMARYSP